MMFLSLDWQVLEDFRLAFFGDTFFEARAYLLMRVWLFFVSGVEQELMAIGWVLPPEREKESERERE